ncbi:helix-hairpin-helix domain-containing protein [Natronorubrum sp. FCH18a]|uniref:helix-hairpin-helix domain-containing protein n=1 Tax=Natronorubrum sp. FCH18a TaxID=3447018 RepID=UPI003F519A6F
MYRDPSIFDFVLFVVAVGLCLFSVLYDRLESDPDPLEELRDRYEAGDIDHAEYERQLEFLLDDRNDRIRHVVEDVNGVGEETSKAIAREFDSLDELRAADRERLVGVPGVGEQTAETVLKRVQ